MMYALERSDYPKCDVVYWDKAVEKTCPQCSSPHLLEKATKRDGVVRYCKNEDCGYKMAVSNTDVTSDSAAEAKAPVG